MSTIISPNLFNLQSEYSPAGDQPQAIQTIIDAFGRDEKTVTMVGATGTGKTFTMANIIQHLQKPTLIISHNKTLAAQLATEFKHFFPNNAVHYFVSYFDYYQPESYIPTKDLYIEKEATINEEIQMYRLATMASLLSRPDVIVVASASSLYGLGQKEFFADHSLLLSVGTTYIFRELKMKLIKMQYKLVQSKIEPGMFDFQGEMLDIYSSTDKVVYRCLFDDETLTHIQVRDSQTFATKSMIQTVTIWPATQYVQDIQDIEIKLEQILRELAVRTSELEKAGKIIEAHRLQKRVEYDVRMIRETGFVNGIENYSPYFDDRLPGEIPYTIFDYFPDDFLLIVDESHMTLPQLQAMPKADTARKLNLINHGFRLPSAIDHRPLRFEELEVGMGRADSMETVLSKKIKADKDGVTLDNEIQLPTDSEKHISTYKNYRNTIQAHPTSVEQNHTQTLLARQKKNAKALFVSATPAPYEKEISTTMAEQIIRPTGLLDPITYVYPKSGDFVSLIQSVQTLLDKKPELGKMFGD